MALDKTRAARRASGRAKGAIDRASYIRFGTAHALILGAALGCAAVAVKAGLNEVFAEDTGFIVLMAATVLAAWFGGLAGGLSATITAVVLNAVFILGAESSGGARVEQVREILYLVVASGTALLVASRRASRDRLVDALDEVASLAEEIEGRDQRLEFMLAASGTGFWEWDIGTGRLDWSEAIFSQNGLESAEAAPSFDAYLDTIHPDDREAFQSAVAATLEAGAPLDLEFRIVWPDGSVHWTHGAGRLMRDDSGRPSRLLGTGQDITERHRMVEERDRLLGDERHAREFREAFVDVISHELRTPITTILGLTQILSRRGRIDDEDSRMALLDDVRSESERLHRLVEDLLVLSRVEHGRLVVEAEPLQPRRLLERIIAQEAPELPGITVEPRLDHDLPIVAGEATYVEQIVRNLLGNAAKYSPAGTTVIVSARRNDNAVEVRIMDNGPGIPEGSLSRIFELFYRDPDSARTVAGSGIGLFVCASLVEAMGGRIWASRRPEGGSEIGFTLRALEGDAVDADGVIEESLAS
ncbi:MAG: ATP-binding protein [Candidatus Limnocylindrales bacterium]